ncbi:MAG: deoxyribodipyrimidine photo-lyase, partial [Phycisphaeraceae bacterium]
GEYVLYWMQASQRAEDNHALEYAVQRANDRGLPVVVGFGLTERFPGTNLRHKTFLLQGLQDVAAGLERRGICFVVRLGEPDDVAVELAATAALVVTDRGYLRHQKKWRQRVAERCAVPVVQVESDVCVPVDTVSEKQEHAARTIRPKVQKKLEEFLVDLRTTPVDHASSDMGLAGEDVSDIDALLGKMKRLDRGVPASPFFTGGTGEAKRRFRVFLDERFGVYADHRNQPQTDDTSHMSPYLHYGQVSPIWLVLRAREARGEGDENVAAFVEELVVRRELAINFVHRCPDYDSYEAIPDFARRTLDNHRNDRREHVYTREQLENAETHDPYWNAAMREATATGYMHNYMRMYWGKKILEWSEQPEDAFDHMIEIMNKYYLDGRDPNSYTGVAWCLGLHDRGWTERDIFGKVRYMNANGLKRKCDIDAYVEKVERLEGGE